MTTKNIESAKTAHLHYSTDRAHGFTRHRRGQGFVYRAPSGKLVRDQATLRRIRSLVLPPAWRDVWIAADPRAHLQATGKDVAGRKQYRYHPAWTKVRDANKYHRVLDFAKALPHIRRRTSRDLREPPLSRTWLLATVIQLLERTHIRIGNEEYLRTNKSRGLTTLGDRNAVVRGTHVRFVFHAKSGVHQTIAFDDARLAKAVRRCQELPGQSLFQYRDHEGAVRDLTSADVNEYLHEVAGAAFTAKDFRTWAGTLAAACALDEFGQPSSKTAAARLIVRAIDRVAAQLGNTRSVCRKCYVHPAVLDAYLAGFTLGRMSGQLPSRTQGLHPPEARLVALLRR